MVNSTVGAPVATAQCLIRALADQPQVRDLCIADAWPACSASIHSRINATFRLLPGPQCADWGNHAPKSAAFCTDGVLGHFWGFKRVLHREHQHTAAEPRYTLSAITILDQLQQPSYLPGSHPLITNTMTAHTRLLSLLTPLPRSCCRFCRWL